MRATCLCVALLLGPPALAGPLVIEHVTVIDATGKQPRADRTVVIEHDRIVAIGPSPRIKAPAQATIVDGRGRYLIPGLWDMHVHAAAVDETATPDEREWGHGLYLANGVVGVREMWGPPDARAWRERKARSGQLSPTILVASPILDGPKPYWPGSIAIADATQARAAVELYAGHGADFIKVYDGLPRDAYFAIADESRRRGLPFEGHVPEAIQVEEASDAGQASMEHLIGLALAASSEQEQLRATQPTKTADYIRRDLRAGETYDEQKAAALFARFVRNRTWQCPTLVVNRAYVYLDGDQYRHEEWIKYVPAKWRDMWAGMKAHALVRPDPAWNEAHREFPFELRLVGRMYRAGVGLLAGSDVENPYVYPGFSLHDELALLVEAGLPPIAALQAATINPARFMGQAAKRGTIEVGKVADLVLLDRDPLADIRNTTAIRAVVLGGRLLDRAALDDLLRQAESDAAR